MTERCCYWSTIVATAAAYFVLLLLSLSCCHVNANFTIIDGNNNNNNERINQEQDTTTTTTCHKNTLIVPEPAIKNREKGNTLVIGHRGASYHIPEHTLVGYRLALELYADYIEPDLVLTSDGILMALHKCDLNITTNVAEKFSEDRMWYSPTAQYKTYWIYNFTYDEIKTLRVKQRLPNSRTTALDGMFEIPSLNEIIQLLYEWNTIDLPTLIKKDKIDDSPDGNRPTLIQTYQAGLYAEFKDSNLILQDTGMDMVQILYQTIHDALITSTTTTDDDNDNTKYWKHLFPCYEYIRYDQYIVPGLVLQSFNGTDLQRFHEMWKDDSLDNVSAEPSYILLANQQMCWKEDFWFNDVEQYRSFLNGIGCEKTCILDNNSEMAETFIAKAEEFDMVLHPWTERPEQEYIVETSTKFNTNYDEMHYMVCNISSVKGYFTESVDVGVRAATTPCPNKEEEDKQKKEEEEEEKQNDNDTTSSKGSSTDLCYNKNQQEDSKNIYMIGFISFIMGTMFALLTSYSFMKYSNNNNNKRLNSQHHHRTQQVPTEDHDDDNNNNSENDDDDYSSNTRERSTLEIT